MLGSHGVPSLWGMRSFSSACTWRPSSVHRPSNPTPHPRCLLLAPLLPAPSSAAAPPGCLSGCPQVTRARAEDAVASPLSTQLWATEQRGSWPAFLDTGGWGELLSAAPRLSGFFPSWPLPPSLPPLPCLGEEGSPRHLLAPSRTRGSSNNPSRPAEPIKPHRQSCKFQGHCCFLFQGEKWACPGHAVCLCVCVWGGVAGSHLPRAQTLQPPAHLDPPGADLAAAGQMRNLRSCCCASSRLCSPALGFPRLKMICGLHYLLCPPPALPCRKLLDCCLPPPPRGWHVLWESKFAFLA